jgi:RNA polymerase sigma factor (sigma-70 family)
LSTNLSNTETDDEVLIREFVKGDAGSFNLLVRKYQKKVYWLIRKMVLDHDDADDITQEVFIKLHGSLKNFKGDSKFFTYVYRIAVNYSLNHLKRRSKINNRKVDFSQVDNISGHSIDYDYDKDKKKKLLENAIGILPPQQRAVFNLRFYENLSYEEISKIMNKSTGGMKSNYFHAIKGITKFLKSKKYLDILELKGNE